MPAFNAERSLARALSSILAQTIPPLEVIVVDDCSTDSTKAVAREAETTFRSAGIDLVYYCLERNSGPSAARNTGLRLARGEYVAFIDSDDEWMPEKLMVVGDVLLEQACDLVCHSYTEVLPAARIGPLRLADYRRRNLFSWHILVRNPAQTSCVIVRRAAGFQFDQQMRYCEDYDLWLRMVGSDCVVLQLLGPPLAILGRPQGSSGGLSGNRIKMRLGELSAYYNFCRQRRFPRMLLLPGLVVLSLLKHALSGIRKLSL